MNDIYWVIPAFGFGFGAGVLWFHKRFKRQLEETISNYLFATRLLHETCDRAEKLTKDLENIKPNHPSEKYLQ